MRKGRKGRGRRGKTALRKASPAKPRILPTPTRGQSRPKRLRPSKPVFKTRPPAAPLTGRWRRWAVGVGAAVVAWPFAGVALYRFVPPPITALMIERLAQGNGLHRRWEPITAISPDLVRAVIASEDARFCRHHGFDFEAMRAAAAHNARDPGKVRGGSTLSQQTAKNVFLWPGRSYLRKGLEAGYTVLIEAVWGKRRILEMYLNEVEWGPGVYGAQAASLRYFGHGADSLDGDEAARLAAILPDPLKWKAVRPGRYVQRRSRRISAGAEAVRTDDLAACVLARN
jgi:monofunctional biosynthetic peptidoglycan transglycosylase